MVKATFRDLKEFGLPFIAAGDSTFDKMLRKLQAIPAPFGAPANLDRDRAAILLNQSGKAIITLSFVWKRTAGGQTATSQHLNLGSNTQVDVLSGRAKASTYRIRFVFPGSARLLTEKGMFGDNSDVLPPEPNRRGSGIMSASSSTGPGGQWNDENLTALELLLDFVIFEDGLCAGPDESGIFERIVADLKLQRETARRIAESMRQGGTAGQAFEMLRPLALQQRRGVDASGRIQPSSVILSMFVGTAVNQLLNFDGQALIAWFNDFAQAEPLPLRRPA